MSYILTSESVSEGHPDKLADQISDAVLDEALRQDPNARVAAETLITTNLIVLAGELSSNIKIDGSSIAKDVLTKVGYTHSDLGICFEDCRVIQQYDYQSADIAIGVDQSLDVEEQIGAGDQGLMFGYACDETIDFFPMPLWVSHSLMKRQSSLRKDGRIDWLRPDAKTQVTVEYDDDKKPVRISHIVFSTQHNPDVSLKEIREAVIEEIIYKTVDLKYLVNTEYLVNPTGRFVIGGPKGDCGLTGRKIIVDTYGGAAPHGGGAFSGKDSTKVDRSAAYMLRYIAKNIVAAGFSKRCLLQLSYAIGVANPISFSVETFGTSLIPEEKIKKVILETFDLRPAGIIKQLELQRPIFQKTATYGHFGRADTDFSWEQMSHVQQLKDLMK